MLVALAVGAGTAGVSTVVSAPQVADGTPDQVALDVLERTTTPTPSAPTTADPSASPTGTPPSSTAEPTTTTTTPSAAPTTSAPSTTATTQPKPTATATTVVKPTTTAPKPPADTSMPGQVLAITNDERAKAGCAPLAIDARLNAAGQGHSEDMAAQNYFSHTSLDGRTFVDRAKAAGYPSPGAENIAKGQRTAAQVMSAWMGSSGHRANILNCGLKTMGLGFVANGFYWTQVFGR
ncbi:hypothetical protein Acsp05_66100 [Actinokineospora sp. NBRC 105648]|nr:hypothetical protein Acsp05_66100 [Actinokineospora sp. NBRC 105648]